MSRKLSHLCVSCACCFPCKPVSGETEGSLGSLRSSSLGPKGWVRLKREFPFLGEDILGHGAYLLVHYRRRHVAAM